MAYGLKYTQYIERGGAQVQIKVYEKDWAGASYGMAHVTGLSLQIIGGQSNILSPLLKTSLSFSLVDAYDQGTTQADGTACVNAQNEKCGRWEEFFTPDATKYKVELISRPSPSASASVIWTGFITPDSWSENMIYRGSVTITARDMLGALQDKEFDLTGRVSVRDVITGALAACECPMSLQLTEAHFLVNSNGHSILDHTFAASTFSGDTWAQALEKTLDSLGLVLRYNGTNKVVLTSLRYLAADTTIGAHGIEFINRSGLRQLDPAVKKIVEVFNVQTVQVAAEDPAASSFRATGSNLTQRAPCSYSLPHDKSIPGYALTAPLTGGWTGYLAVPRPTQVYQDLGAIPDRGLYFLTDIITAGISASWSNPLIRAPFSFCLAQDGPVMRYTVNGATTIVLALSSFQDIVLSKLRVVIQAAVNGQARYLNTEGVWQTQLVEHEIDPGATVNVPALEGGEGFTIVINNIATAYNGDWQIPECTAVALSLSVSPAQSSTTPTEYKTTTIYNEENNVVINRAPKIGSASSDFCTPFVENVLALGDDIAPDEWNWPGASAYFPLAVMIQAQVLCFHAAAASVFTGTAHDKATPEAAALPGYRIGYYDRVGVLLSGTYDFCSGFVAQTIAREFYTWEEVWGAFAPDYTTVSGAGKGSTSATGAGGSSASGGSSGGGGGTSVNYFEPDGDYGNGIKLRDSYDGLRLPGIRLGGGDAALDLEVITVNGQRCLHSPLPIFSDKDIAGFYDGGSGGSPSDFDEAAMWAALGGTIGVNEVIDISHIPNLPTTKIYDLETWISGKGFLTQVPVASSSQLGGVKIGSGISIASDGTISAASSEELALAVAMNASRLDDLEAAFDAPVFGELYAETLRSRSASATELWIGAVRLWYQDGSVRVSGGVLADGDVSGFYNGGSGGGGGSFDESAMWQALGTDITTQVIDASHLPTSPVTSVVGLTGAISQADLRTALGLGSFAYISSLAFSGLSSHPTTLAGYGITDAAFGTPGTDYVPVTLGGTTKNVLTAHQSLAGYLTTTSAAATYETIANVDAVEQRLALALGTNEARIAALEEWAEAPAVGELYVENLRARMAATDEIRIGGVTITADMIDGKPYLMIAGGVTATLDVSGFYDGGSGGSGSSSFDEAAMWTALGGTIGTNEKVSTAHLPMSDLDTWVAGKGFVTSSGVTSISMTVPTGFSVSGVPITSTGTLALAFASGYSLPTTAKQGNWDSAYSNSHTHSNKSVLDGITSSKVNNWDAAYGWGNHANAGYLLATTAAGTYETIGNVDTVEKRLAAALGVAIARLNTLDDWTADVVPELQRYTDTVLGDVRQPLEVALACCASRLDALEYAFADGQFADLKVTTLGVDYLATRGNAWIGGSVCAAGDVGGFYGSDRALKDDIRDFSCKSAADILRRIRLVSFTWNARASRLNADNVGEDFGVIAQEVEAACPRMVRHGHYGEDLLGVDYSKRLPSVLLGGWHDHERRIAALERENKQLKEKLRQNGCI